MVYLHGDSGQRSLTFDLQEAKGVMIIDAGGGTLDFSSYAQNGQDLMEIAASQCRFATLVSMDNSYERLGIYNGSVFVTTRAKSFFQGTISDQKYILVYA